MCPRARDGRVSGYRGPAFHPLSACAPGGRGGPGQAVVGPGGHLRGDVHQRDGHDDRERRAAGHVERPRRRHWRAAVGARRVPRLARRAVALRQWAGRSVRAAASVSVGVGRLRGRVRADGRVADGGRGDRRAGADGRGGGLRAASGAVAPCGALPARAAAEGGGDLVGRRGSRAGPRAGCRRCARRRGGLALGVSGQRPVRAGGRSARAALAARVAAAGGAPARPPRRGALHRRADRDRLRSHRGRRRGMDEPGCALRRGGGHRRRRRVLRRRAPPGPPAVRRACARPPAAVGAFAIFAAYIASLGMLFLLPQHVQYVQDGSALASGLELASFGVGLGALAPVGGRLVGRYGPRVVLLAGLLTATAGFVPLLLRSGDSSPALLVLGTGIVGCGLGLTVPPATAVIMNDLGLEKAGDGAAVNQLARQVGGALGVAIVGSVFAAIYAAEVADDRVPPAPKESNQGKTDLASRLHGAARVDLLHDAVTSFDVAARWGLAVCMAAVLLSAASAAIGLTGVTRAKR